jgi:hypothetical protein
MCFGSSKSMGFRPVSIATHTNLQGNNGCGSGWVQVDLLTPTSNASHTKSGASQATASWSKTTRQSKMASNLDSGALKTFRGNINRANRERSTRRRLMLPTLLAMP